MASLTILYWRDIPSQVIVKSGRSAAKRQLSERFIRAIDAAAMHAGAKSDDAYLAEWRRGEPIPCGDDLENEAAAAAERLEKEYDTHRLALLAKHDGRETRRDARVARRPRIAPVSPPRKRGSRLSKVFRTGHRGFLWMPAFAGQRRLGPL